MLYNVDIPQKMVELFKSSRDPDQTPRSVASDLGLHCVPVTRLGASSLQWVNDIEFYIAETEHWSHIFSSRDHDTYFQKKLPTLLASCSFCGCLIVFVCLSLWCWGIEVDLVVSVP